MPGSAAPYNRALLASSTTDASRRSPGALALGVGAGALLLSRLLFLPPSLEDVDSTNFARALADFDPVVHQPHPPGYPVYVFAAKLVALVVAEPARALAALSAVSQTLLAVPLFSMFRSLATSTTTAWAALLLTLTNPILWFNGARPLSDSFGLLLIVTALALLLRSAAGEPRLAAASILVGLSPGARLQSVVLSVPLWLLAFARGRRRGAAFASLAGGVLLWLVPLVLASGGLGRYMQSFNLTMGEALAWEPLLSDFTLNRAARAGVHVVLGPWASRSLGALATLLAVTGFGFLAVRRPAGLGLALLAFAPYAVVHALMQHVETFRYSLPYIPLLALLAAEGVAGLAAALPGRSAAAAQIAATTALALWSAITAVPALRAYSAEPSPPYRALGELQRQAAAKESVAVAGHHVFSQYLRELPSGFEWLVGNPEKPVPRLVEYWRDAGRKPVLFMADPGRTDLESVEPEARKSLGSWRWGFRDDRFLAGMRPRRAELVRIDPPRWFAGEGYLLSLDMGRVSELIRFPLRRAYVAALPEPTFLMLAGDPTGPASQYTMKLELDGKPIGEHPCGDPLLRGFRVDTAQAAGYRELVARSERAGAVEGAPFALKALDYGTEREAGVVHGSGWFYMERDEDLRPFRWTSARARSLLHVPAPGATLVVEGVAPLEYLGEGVRVAVSLGGTPIAETVLRERPFKLEARLGAGAPGFQELALTTDRTFVPDEHQRNGDRRRLGLRVYRFHVE
jgi:hypothetical protein